MPNHTTSSVVIIGDPAQVREVHDIINDGDGNVTFDKLIPMPEELAGTKSPLEIVDTQEEADAKNAELAEKFKDTPIMQSTFYVISRAEYARRVQEYGSADWYDWAIKHWGTKWNAYETTHLELVDAEAQLELQFDTAWSMPSPVFEKLAKDYGVKVYVVWQDEGSPDIIRSAFGKGADADETYDDVMHVQTVVEFS
jgi:hypothetical protein